MCPTAAQPSRSPNADRLAKKTGKTFRVGIFLDFVWLTTRTPHGAYVRRARRNRIDRHGGEIERLALQAEGMTSQIKRDFMKEAAVMAFVGKHPNVVELVGVVTRGDHPWVMVVPFCDRGDLGHNLAKRAADGTPYTTALKVGMCTLTKKSGKIFRVGIFLDFVWLTTRTPHGAYVRRARRNRIDAPWGWN